MMEDRGVRIDEFQSDAHPLFLQGKAKGRMEEQVDTRIKSKKQSLGGRPSAYLFACLFYERH